MTGQLLPITFCADLFCADLYFAQTSILGRPLECVS